MNIVNLGGWAGPDARRRFRYPAMHIDVGEPGDEPAFFIDPASVRSKRLVVEV
jgi:hypothetical protein